MAQEFKQHLEKLDPLLDEYLRWFLRISSYVFYPYRSSESPELPTSFSQWMQTVKSENLEKYEALRSIDQVYRDLVGHVQYLLQTVKAEQQQPDFQDYDKLAVCFEEFMNMARRAEKDFIFENFGVDTLTGLRSEAVLEKDIQLELDRLNRHGKNFSVVLTKVNQMDEVKAHADKNTKDNILKTISLEIRNSIRSFDDAYILYDSTFLMVIKQTELLGALNAVERLKTLIDGKKMEFIQDGAPRNVTISSSVMQPVTSDTPDNILESLKSDLAKQDETTGEIKVFKEKSTVKQFLDDDNNGN